MPTYVYACDTCGKNFELQQRFHDDPLRVCPCEQQSTAVRRVIQPAGVVFKGSGWYINDSRSSATSKSEKTRKADTTDTADATDTAAKPEGADTAAKPDATSTETKKADGTTAHDKSAASSADVKAA